MVQYGDEVNASEHVAKQGQPDQVYWCRGIGLITGGLRGTIPGRPEAWIDDGFGNWEQILEEPDYPEWRLVSRAVRRYARSVACSAVCRTEQARVELEAFEEAVGQVPEDWWVIRFIPR